MNAGFLIALCVWIGTSLFRSCFEWRKFQHFRLGRDKLKDSKAMFRALIFTMFFMWSSWVFMAFSDPVKISAAKGVTYLGIALCIVGSVIFILSEMTRGSVVDKGFLVTRGLYSKVRHPMYLGQFFMAVGFPLMAGGLVTLCLSVFWLDQLLLWRAAEERELLAKHPEYEEYKKRTWF